MLLEGIAASAAAEGFRNPNQEAATFAQATAFMAQADDASAIYYNPAGLAQLASIQAAVGVQLVNHHITFTSPNGQTVDSHIPGGCRPATAVTVLCDGESRGLWQSHLAPSDGRPWDRV